MQVISLLSYKLQDANQRNLIFSTYDPKARLAGFLLYEHERNHGKVISMRLDDMAAAISLRPETVSRKMSELQNDGMVEKSSRSDFKLLDIDALKHLFAGA
ncbi:MAG: winged helix-turn-helix domain-containing protein [Oscillibacter sp.]|nr:winged helix-turn-helix domain-containing protein [Oscillibacter sp.]